MLVEMARVQVIGLRTDFPRTLAAVHAAGVLDVRPLRPPHPFETPTIRGATVDRGQIAEVERTAERLAGVLALLPERAERSLAAPPSGVRPTPELLAEASDLLDAVEPACGAYRERATTLEAERSALAQHESLVWRLLPIAERIVELEGFETVALVIQPPYRYVVDALREQLAEITRQQCELVAAESDDGGVAVLLVFSRRYAADVHALLRNEQLSEVRLPATYYTRPLRETLHEIARRQAEIPLEMEAIRTMLRSRLEPSIETLVRLRRELLDRLDEMVLVASCLESTYAFALGGWVPARDLLRFEQSLAGELGGRVVVDRLPVSREEWSEMPVLLENPPLVRPFEVLLRLLPSPRYGSIDPTPFLAFFFPFFFGLMLADVGYGALLLVLALAVGRRGSGPGWLRQGSRVIAAGSVVAILFGFAFGECFGNLGAALGLRPLLATRTSAIQPLLLFSLGVGAIQVGLGLVLGAINGFVERQRKEAFSRIGTLAALVAVFGLIGVAADLLPGGLLTPGVALLAGSTALLVYSVGLIGPLEVVGALGNVLSYTRLIAVGLSSAILADVANQMAGRTGSLLLGAIVGALFHGLNLALGLFSPSIHSLRLQYVEFLGRFYQPGGTPYTPFRRRPAVLADGGSAT